MESTISSADEPLPGGAALEDRCPLDFDTWNTLLERLPADLDRSAHDHRALLRRRGIGCAADLLRLAFFYALPDWSLRQIGLRAKLLGVCALSDVAILNRLRACRAWLGALLLEMLVKRGLQLQTRTARRLRILDATVITQPGSRGTDWRLHLGLDLEHLCIDQLALTDGHGGEGCGNFSFAPHEIVLADSLYGYVRSLAQPLAVGAQFVVRAQWNVVPLYDHQGHRFDVIAWLRRTFPTGATTPAETPVWLHTPQGPRQLRLGAAPLPPEKVEAARQRARKKSRHDHRQPDERNLYAVGFLIVLSNLPPQPWDLSQVLQLYRWRWQIELYIKRLKSLLHLDQLRTKDPDLAQTYLLSKLLLAVLVDELRTGTAQQLPDPFGSAERPLSLWRLDVALIDLLASWVIGRWADLDQFQRMLPELQRYLCGPPRKRHHQFAAARSQLAALPPNGGTIC